MPAVAKLVAVIFCLLTNQGRAQQYIPNPLDTAPGTWHIKKELGTNGREGVTGFSIGSKGYIGTGLSYHFNGNVSENVFHNDFWEYDPVTNVWTQKADFAGGARWRSTGFAIGNKGYMGTGAADISFNEEKSDFWEYDPATNRWSQKANFGGGIRAQATGFSIGGRGYIGLGSGDGYLHPDFWEYNPITDAWIQKASYTGQYRGSTGQSRGSAVGFGIGNKGYIGTGSGNTNMADFWEYDVAADGWTRKADFGGVPRQGAVAFSMAGKGYIGTGLDNSSAVHNDFWEYDPVRNAWTQKASFEGSSRCFAVGFSIGNKGYIGTGVPLSGLANDFWEFTPGPISGANNITTNVHDTILCSGKPFSVNYTATGTFNPGNEFIAQLSADAGFSNVRAIGAIASTASGTITAVIPAGVASNPGYRIRVVSTNPIVASNSNGNDLFVNPPPVIKVKCSTVYLGPGGRATITPAAVDNGSYSYCGILSYSLTQSTFTCADLGRHPTTLVIQDGNARNSLTTTVNVVDKIKPALTGVFASPGTLWPPNHRMVPVAIHYTATDNCEVVKKELSVSSNEPNNDGQADWVILNDHQVLLRAEKNSREGRQYTIAVKATDVSGNYSICSTRVKVAHCSSAKEMPVQDNPGQSLAVEAMPNPSSQYFTLVIHRSSELPVYIHVKDAMGRVVEAKTIMVPGNTLQLGMNYKPGMYFVQLLEGNEAVSVKLIKM